MTSEDRVRVEAEGFVHRRGNRGLGSAGMLVEVDAFFCPRQKLYGIKGNENM